MVRVEATWKVRVPAYRCPSATRVNQHGKHVEGQMFCGVRKNKGDKDIRCLQKNCPNVCDCWRS
jgi:hypothetical protein